MQSYRAYACQYFGSRSGMKSCYNLAMTNLMENFRINYTAETITPDYPSLYFSKGNLLGAVPLGMSLKSAESLEISWQDNSAGNPERENDVAQILIAGEDNDFTFFVENAAKRSDIKYSVTYRSTFKTNRFMFGSHSEQKMVKLPPIHSMREQFFKTNDQP